MDERRETYQRLVAGLLQLPVVESANVRLVGFVEVISLLAEEFLVERRGQTPAPASSQSENTHE